jgi:integrase
MTRATPESEVSSKSTTDHINLPRFGEHRVTLYRRTDVGESHWHMRVYLKSEGRYFRKGLGTHDPNEAQKLAQHELIRLLTRLEAGQTILSPSIAKLIQDYMKVLEEQLKHKEMRPPTYKNATHRINLGRDFLVAKLKSGLQTKLSTLDGSIFDGYLAWRKQSNPEIRRDVVHQELLVIKRMFSWAVKKRMAGEKTIPQWEFKVEAEKAKRADIGIEDFFNVLVHADKWRLQETTMKQGYYRNLMFHVLAVMFNSGLRTGEVLHMKRADVGKLYDGLLCDVKIHGTNTKRKQTRSITIGGLLSGPSDAFRNHNWLWDWMARHAQHKNPDDYVFAATDGRYVENAFFKTYGQFREYLKQFNFGHITAYHARHAFISDRLRAGVPPIIIAAHCGTSIRMISQTYSHITGLEASKEIAKKPYVYGVS